MKLLIGFSRSRSGVGGNMRCTTADVRDSVVGGVNSRTMFYEKPLGVCGLIAGSFLKNRKGRVCASKESRSDFAK